MNKTCFWNGLFYNKNNNCKLAALTLKGKCNKRDKRHVLLPVDAYSIPQIILTHKPVDHKHVGRPRRRRMDFFGSLVTYLGVDNGDTYICLCTD